MAGYTKQVRQRILEALKFNGLLEEAEKLYRQRRRKQSAEKVGEALRFKHEVLLHQFPPIRLPGGNRRYDAPFDLFYELLSPLRRLWSDFDRWQYHELRKAPADRKPRRRLFFAEQFEEAVGTLRILRAGATGAANRDVRAALDELIAVLTRYARYIRREWQDRGKLVRLPGPSRQIYNLLRAFSRSRVGLIHIYHCLEEIDLSLEILKRVYAEHPEDLPGPARLDPGPFATVHRCIKWIGEEVQRAARR